MYCPNCITTRLVLTQRQRVDIDYCPHCRGVWLDRGELEKLLERAAGSAPDAPGIATRAPRSRAAPPRQDRRLRNGKRWLAEFLDERT
jgi:Zn-finger nucleic acid-binding protein